jgi:hypothetical protein
MFAERRYDLKKTTILLAVLAVGAGCVSVSKQGASVRVTTNPEVVRGCQYLGSVNSTSGWGGPAGTGLGTANTEADMRNKAAGLGGDILFVTATGVHASGEVYKQGPNITASTTPAPQSDEPAAKLRDLKKMLSEGLISEDEYQAKRKLILDKM